MSLVIPETNALPNFTWEKPLIEYIYNQWSIPDPAKPATYPSNDEISFRVGFFDFFRPYEVNVLFISETPTWWDSGKRRVWLQDVVQVWLRMQRIERDAVSVDPQLSQMEFEIIRIAMQYQRSPQAIGGIKELTYAGRNRPYEVTDDHTNTDWRSTITLNLTYEIQNMQP